MQGQCEFETLSDTETAGAFEHALDKFYQKAVENKVSLSKTDSGMYLENEITMHIKKDDLTNAIVAVTVQLNDCAVQIPGSDADCASKLSRFVWEGRAGSDEGSEATGLSFELQPHHIY